MTATMASPKTRRRPMSKTYRLFEKTAVRPTSPTVAVKDRGDGVVWASLRLQAARKILSTFQGIADRDRAAGREPSPTLMDRLVSAGLHVADMEADLDRVKALAKIIPAYVDEDDLETEADDEGVVVDG